MHLVCIVHSAHCLEIKIDEKLFVYNWAVVVMVGVAGLRSRDPRFNSYYLLTVFYRTDFKGLKILLCLVLANLEK